MTSIKKNSGMNGQKKTVFDPVIENLEHLVRHTKGVISAIKKIREEARKFPGMLKF